MASARERKHGMRRRYRAVGCAPDGKRVFLGTASHAKLADAVAEAADAVSRGWAAHVNDYGPASTPFDAPEIVWMDSPALRALRAVARD